MARDTNGNIGKDNFEFVFSSNLLQRGGVGEGGLPKRSSAEAEIVDLIGRRVLRVFIFAIHNHLYYRFYPLPHLSKRFETSL
jgi:hypothetical protein